MSAFPDPALRPSRQLEDLLTGRTPWEDASPAIRSWARLTIHDAAKQILAQPSKGERRNMLARVPAPMRPHVEAEVKRLWAMR